MIPETTNVEALNIMCYGLATYSAMLKLLLAYFYNRLEKLVDKRLQELINENIVLRNELNMLKNNKP